MAGLATFVFVAGMLLVPDDVDDEDDEDDEEDDRRRRLELYNIYFGVFELEEI